MGLNMVFSFLVPIVLIVMGIMLKYSTNDGWQSYKRNWLYLIIIGLFLLAFRIYKYLM